MGNRHCRPVARPARRMLACTAAVVAALGGAAAQAQDARRPARPKAEAAGEPELVVTGMRRRVVTDIAPIASLDADALAAIGATNMADIRRAIRGVSQSADGSEPIFLLNAQRVSGYQEIATLPPEAIERVEVLPEPVALNYGFPPTRRVVNFITKRRFRQVQARATAGSTTRGGSARGTANLDLTRLHDDGRLTLALEATHSGAVRPSERTIAPDPGILFDAIGNVIGLGGGEIDPALSAAAGETVTVAAVPVAPADRASLAGFAAGANRVRLFDTGPFRTLTPRNDAVKAEAVIANPIGKMLAGSFSVSAERRWERSLAGPAPASLVVPRGHPHSPFAGPVLLQRFLTETDILRQARTTTKLHAGTTLRGAIGGWRWDLTTALDQEQASGWSERGIDLAAANAAIVGGADPFAPLGASLLATRLTDRARLRTRNASAKTVATNAPIRLPAGPATVTATLEAEHASARSATRGPNPFDLSLARNRGEAGLAIGVPLASRREGVLAWAGELSANASANARAISGFGTLYDATYGLNWAPIDGVQLSASVRSSEAAPGLSQLSTPTVRLANVPAFDFASGRTELVTLVQGGNRDLEAERRTVRSVSVNFKPFAARELRISATYEAATIHNQTGTIYALTPQIEAIFPELAVRDAAGRLSEITLRPINFHRQRQRTLNMTLFASGTLGTPPPPPKPGEPPPRPKPNYYLGMGPSIKFSDRLQLRPGTPALDILAGDTITGGAVPHAFGYFYGGLNHFGNGVSFGGWYGGASRVRGADPAADLRFTAIFRMDLGGYLSLHHFLPHEQWTRHLQLRLDVSNLTDARQRVRDGNGAVPNRYQPDYLDPVGRTVSVGLRKLF